MNVLLQTGTKAKDSAYQQRKHWEKLIEKASK
jgi:hypothetical protein